MFNIYLVIYHLTCFRDDDDINDVASMAGVNLNEESARILATNSELVGTQIRSCKDEAFLHPGLLHRRILETGETCLHHLSCSPNEIPVWVCFLFSGFIFSIHCVITEVRVKRSIFLFCFGLNLTLLAASNQFFSGCLNLVDLRHTHKSFMGLYFEGWLSKCPLDKKKRVLKEWKLAVKF